VWRRRLELRSFEGMTGREAMWTLAAPIHYA